MTLKTPHSLSFRPLHVGLTCGFAAGLMTLPVRAALTPAQINDFRNTIGNRIETETILGGDYGVGGGAYNSGSGGNNVDLNISKFGGWGDVGTPQQLGNLDIGWQPQVQGSMGYLTAKKTYKSSSELHGDQNENKTFAIQFGGGARFWFDDHFSIAPTLMGMYGHSENSYTARSAFALANKTEAKQLGLIDWSVDTWTIRPSMELQYQYTWHRTIFTFSSDPTYFYTENFSSSSANVDVSGNSVTWENKIDVDVPLGMELFGHELRSGGYVSRMELYDGIRDGLHSEYLYEVHPRVVLDFLGELWKVQWIGIGASYYWGNDFTGWSVGADVAFRF
jgi:Solitary outer membrane autotransporter beta-barrel domain